MSINMNLVERPVNVKRNPRWLRFTFPWKACIELLVEVLVKNLTQMTPIIPERWETKLGNIITEADLEINTDSLASL